MVRMKKALLLAATHIAAAGIGFAAGIYLLPVLIAPAAPTAGEVRSAAAGAAFQGEFRRDLKGSDLLHWGEGQVSVHASAVSLMGRLAPGPDYKLYLTQEFVETEEAFLKVKPQAARIGDVRTFENFIVPVPAGVDVSQYGTVVVWCESFSQFISAARYR